MRHPRARVTQDLGPLVRLPDFELPCGGVYLLNVCGYAHTTEFPLNGRLNTAAAVKLVGAPISLRHVMSQGLLYCGGHSFPALLFQHNKLAERVLEGGWASL